MMLYDLLSYDKSLPRHRMLSARETLLAEPPLRAEGLQGAASYYDAQVESPERLAVEKYPRRAIMAHRRSTMPRSGRRARGRSPASACGMSDGETARCAPEWW